MGTWFRVSALLCVSVCGVPYSETPSSVSCYLLVKLRRGATLQDLTCKLPMSTHLAATFESPGSAFTGGFARIAMKQMASSLNLYVPQQYREEYPFMSNFAIGVGFSPLLNLPRMLQLGRIGGQSYPQVGSRLCQKTVSVPGLVLAHSHGLVSSQTCFRGRCGISLSTTPA